MLVLLCAVEPGRAYEENPEARNALYIELLGNAGLYSMNYDRTVVTLAERHRIGFRVGLSLVPLDTLGVQFPLVFPVTLNYLYGRQRRLEIGAGVAPRVVFDKDWSPSVSVHLATTLGFRLQRFDNDFVFRVGFTPLFFDGVFPWVGVSLGRAF